jgi:hypothetical protein
MQLASGGTDLGSITVNEIVTEGVCLPVMASQFIFHVAVPVCWGGVTSVSLGSIFPAIQRALNSIDYVRSK